MSSGKSVVVLIGGGHASGKKTTAVLLKEELEKTLGNSPIKVELVDMSNYEDKSTDVYSTTVPTAITIDHNEKKPALKPSRFDFEKIRSFLQGSPTEHSQTIYLVYGLYALYDRQLREMSDIKVFISSDADVRLIRWINRDVINGAKVSLNLVLNSYLQGSRQEMSDYIITTKEYADVIMPRGADSNAVQLILDGVFKNLNNVKYGGHIESHLRPHDDAVVYDQYHGTKHNYYDLN